MPCAAEKPRQALSNARAEVVATAAFRRTSRRDCVVRVRIAPVPVVRTSSSRRVFRRRTIMSRVHQSSTTISDTAHGTRCSYGSRSSHDIQQRVISRIRRPKRRQHSRRRQRLPEQTQVPNIYIAPTFKSSDFNVNHTIHSTVVVISPVVRV